MNLEEDNQSTTTQTAITADLSGLNQNNVSPLIALVDLIIFLSTMFIIRTISFSSIGFWGNVLVNSLATIGVATLLLYYRGQSWKSLGLTKPQSYLKMLGIVAITLVCTIASVMLFEIFIRDILTSSLNSEASSSIADTRFQEMKGNISYFFSIIFLVWIESFLEELQDRGFSLNRFESLFSKIPLSIVLAVITQAAIFGFRHSSTHGFSGAIVTGIIGLVFGIAYVVFGRNLWALVIAHSILNTMSMIERL